MACFLAPASVAIATTSVRKKIPEKYHIEWLNGMLWGGVVMLIVDHIAKGEIVFYPPFLTAMNNPADIPMMFQEIATIGGAMTVAILFVWIITVFIYNFVTKTRPKNTVLTT